MTADHVTIDLAGSSILASGSVRLIAPPLLVEASSVEVDLEAGSLTLTDAALELSLEQCSVSARASLAEAAGGRISLESGALSLCSCDPPPWGAAFGSLSLDVDGDLLVRRGWLTVSGRRVLPVPWMLLRTGRKPGLLPPRIGWLGRRGFLVGLGLWIPLPRSWDISLTTDWIAIAGMGLGATIESPSGGLATGFILDPVDEGLASAWIAGSLHAGSARQHAGIALDLPLVTRMDRADMPGIEGPAGRIALDELSIRLEPGTAFVSLVGEVSAARVLEPSGSTLVAGATWMRLPSVSLLLLPVRVLGPSLPVVLGARIHHVQLVPVLGTHGSRLDWTDAGIDLSGRWVPGGALDLDVTAAWHGALLRNGEDLDPPVWIQSARAGASAKITLMGPASPSGLAHRIDLGVSARGSIMLASADWDGRLSALVPGRPPPLLAGLTLANALVRVRGEMLSLRASAWLVPPAHAALVAIVSLDLALRAGPFHLSSHLDLPSDGFRPSLSRSTLSLSTGDLSLSLDHIYLVRSGATSLDVDAWAYLALLPPQREAGLHAVSLGAGIPLARGLALGARAGLDLDSHRPAWIEGSISFSHPCECLTVRLVAQKRASVPYPDVLLTLGL